MSAGLVPLRILSIRTPRANDGREALSVRVSHDVISCGAAVMYR